MKKILLFIMLFILTTTIFAQARLRSEEASAPEIDNLSGLMPDEDDFTNTSSPVGYTTGGSTSESDNSLDINVTSVVRGSKPQQAASARDISVYPNPASEFIYIQIKGIDEGIVRVLNILGQESMFFNISGEETRLDISGLKEGIYFISIEGGTEKIVKKIKVLD